MKREVYPGAYFVHQLVTGERVVLYQHSHFDTHLGRLAFPAGESWGLLFLHCTNVPEFKFSGLSHDAPGSQMEWSQSHGWQRAVYLTGRTVYDHRGVLRDTTPAGYQFVNDAGEPVSRLIAYETRNGLNEWTETGGLLIGQGHDSGGVCVYDGTTLRVLDTGECYFVIVDRIGDQFCISYVKSGEGAIVVTATRADLLNLPSVGTTLPDPGPPTPPEPTPTMPQAPNQLALIQRVIREHPEINTLSEGPQTPNRGGITQIVAQTLGFPFGRKSRNKEGTNLNDDGLTYRLQDNRFEIYDILSGATGQATWDYAGTFMDGQNGYFASVTKSDGGGPAPVPASPTVLSLDVAPALKPLADRVADLAAQVKAQAAEIAALRAQVVAGHDRGAALEDGAVVALKAHGSGAYITGEPDGKVSAFDRPFGDWQLFTIEVQK